MLDSIKVSSVKTFVKGAYWKIKDQSQYSRYTGAFNFGLLCATQSAYMAVDKNIPDNSKKFLVSSEIFEGIMKVAMFLGLANLFGELGVALVNKGHIVPKCVADVANCKKLTAKAAAKTIENIKKMNPSDPAFKQLEKFTGGVKVMSNIAGMIVGLSIFVPIARNYMAKHFRENVLNKNQPAKSDPNKIKDIYSPIYYKGNNVYDKFVRNQ